MSTHLCRELQELHQETVICVPWIHVRLDIQSETRRNCRSRTRTEPTRKAEASNCQHASPLARKTYRASVSGAYPQGEAHLISSTTSRACSHSVSQFRSMAYLVFFAQPGSQWRDSVARGCGWTLLCAPKARKSLGEDRELTPFSFGNRSFCDTGPASTPRERRPVTGLVPRWRNDDGPLPLCALFDRCDVGGILERGAAFFPR